MSKAFATGLMILGLMLLAYSIANTQAITGNVAFDYGDPKLGIQWAMLCASAIIVIVGFIFLFFRNKKKEMAHDEHCDVQHIT